MDEFNALMGNDVQSFIVQQLRKTKDIIGYKIWISPNTKKIICLEHHLRGGIAVNALT